MDLYEAIEKVDTFVDALDKFKEILQCRFPKRYTTLMDEDLVKAIKICLETARDKAGV